MPTFLEQTARQLYEKWGEEISSLNLLFPSRRARLFFMEALSKLVPTPVWQPATTSIDELMGRIAGQRAGDEVRLIVELYRVWSRFHDESFDSFYFWGGMLLADFDAIDKYLVDADMLLGNVRDLKILEADHSYLSAEQKELVRRFWASFSQREGFSGEQEQFLRIWRTLGGVYHAYRERLAEQGMAYTGMMHRTAVERIARGEVPDELRARRYAVIGFNALTECEQRLFDYLRREAEVDFFWDTDTYYLNNPAHEAGHFMRANVQRYAPANGAQHRHFEQPKRIEVVSAPSEVLQCKYVHRVLQQIDNPGTQTAVVLCDEGLLETLLHSMPVEVGAINVTMGYPLRRTLVYSLVERLVELQRRRRGATFYHSDVLGLLRHPFVTAQGDTAPLVRTLERQRRIYIAADALAADPLPAALFTPCDGWEAMGEWLLDILERIGQQDELTEPAVEQIRKLCNSLKNCSIDLSIKVFASLLRRQLQRVRIPYEGEPLEGVQVMGFLETRTLDFENVIVLSAGDDVLPGSGSGGSSFIPYSLRVGYGLPTAAHHEAMYAYYFYRLLQRARTIHLLYCSRSDERRRGEPSRYIYQLDYESPHPLTRREIALDAHIPADEAVVVEKRGETLDKLNAYLDKTSGRHLSPTAFFNYVVCPMRFYYRSVAAIRIEEEFDEGVDARTLGNILHRAMEMLYRPLLGMVDPQIERLEVEQAVDRAIGEHYFHDPATPEADYGGNLQIVREVVVRYIRRGILPFDARQRGVVFEALEQPLAAGIPFERSGERFTAWFAGTADRLDRLEDGALRVVDYKTARRSPTSLVMEFTDVASLLIGPTRSAMGAAVQTLIYALMLSRMEPDTPVEPAIYAVRHMAEPDYSCLLHDKTTGMYVRRYSDYAEAFEEQLRLTLAEMFDPAVPFARCADEKQCQYCDYATLCGR